MGWEQTGDSSVCTAMEQAAGGAAIRDPLIGTVLDERYHVLRRIGRGGMGIVYLAQHVLIGRKYAIKTLSERANASDEMVARFRREALAAAAVGSQHVVEVTDMGRLPDGTLYIALEYLEGIELASAVQADGPFSVARAVNIACQLCDALGAVHEKGIVHRDLKPENLFLIETPGAVREQGAEPALKDFLKVLDFGVCKLLEGAEPSFDPDSPALTRTNASLGTPQYMAPEQFQTSACVDQRADIHAAGAILYYMLTGRPPFDAPSLPQLYMRICVEPPPPLLLQRPDVSQELDSVVRRAMSKHPEDRFASSALLKAALLPFAEAGFERPSHVAPKTPYLLSTQPTQTALDTAAACELPSSMPPLPERGWRRPLLALGLVLFVVCGVGWGAGALAPSGEVRATGKARAHDAPTAVSKAPAIGPIVDLTLGESVHPALIEAAPQAPKPIDTRVSAQGKNKSRPPPSAQTAAPAEPSALPEAPEAAEPAPEAAEQAQLSENAAADASFRFPRRALKRVF